MLHYRGKLKHTSVSRNLFIGIIISLVSFFVVVLSISIVQRQNSLEAQAVTGTKKGLYIFFKFNTDSFWTRESSVITEVNNYFNEASFGRMLTTGDAYGVYNITPQNGFACDLEDWYAKITAQASSINFANYDFLVFSFPTRSACTFASKWQSQTNRIWLNGVINASSIVHQLGHMENFGGLADTSGNDDMSLTDMMHNNVDVYGQLSADHAGPYHFNTADKDKWGWFTNAEKLFLNGSYQTHIKLNSNWNKSLASGAYRAIAVRKQDTNDWYYLTFKFPKGFDSGLSGIIPATGAVFIHEYPYGSQGKAQLVSYPLTQKDDYLNDLTNKIQIRLNSVTAAYADISVVAPFGGLGDGNPVPTINPAPTPKIYKVAGKVYNTNGAPVPGVKVQVQRVSDGKSYYPVTDAKGVFSQGGFIVEREQYNVKVVGNTVSPQTAPAGYLPPATTLTAIRAINFCLNPRRDVPIGSQEYTCQTAGTNDCAGLDQTNKNPYRCNFVYQQTHAPNPWPSNGSDLTTVKRFVGTSSQRGPCFGKPGSTCTLETRTLNFQNNFTFDSITAYGKVFNYSRNADGTYSPWPGNNEDLTSVVRYIEISGVKGPCYGKAAGTCKFDTRTFDKDGNESITAYGRAYNYFPNLLPWPQNGGDLAGVSRFVGTSALPGPCFGKAAGTCKFDSREFLSNGTESITAYGKLYNFSRNADGTYTPWSSNNTNLTAVSRYATGPCKGKTGAACVFDTRSFYNAGGGESITTYGKFWNF